MRTVDAGERNWFDWRFFVDFQRELVNFRLVEWLSFSPFTLFNKQSQKLSRNLQQTTFRFCFCKRHRCHSSFETLWFVMHIQKQHIVCSFWSWDLCFDWNWENRQLNQFLFSPASTVLVCSRCLLGSLWHRPVFLESEMVFYWTIFPLILRQFPSILRQGSLILRQKRVGFGKSHDFETSSLNYETGSQHFETECRSN